MKGGSHPSEDPGRRQAWRGLAWGAIPGVGISHQRRLVASGRTDTLTTLRALFGSFCAGYALLGIVVAVLSGAADLDIGLSGTAVGIAVLAIGLLALLALRFISRPLDCRGTVKLAASYNTRFFVRMALAESVALLGFAGFIVTGHGWLYPLGLAFTAVGFYWLAPTARNLARDQEELNKAGCSESLVAALRTTRPPGTGKG
jgi:hypothetical protein